MMLCNGTGWCFAPVRQVLYGGKRYYRVSLWQSLIRSWCDDRNRFGPEESAKLLRSWRIPCPEPESSQWDTPGISGSESMTSRISFKVAGQVPASVRAARHVRMTLTTGADDDGWRTGSASCSCWPRAVVCVGVKDDVAGVSGLACSPWPSLSCRSAGIGREDLPSWSSSCSG